MTKFNVLPHDMKLYSAAEPKGRVFLQGEPWPGDAWSAKPGGDAVGKETAASAMRELSAAQAQIEQMQDMFGSMEHDMAQLSKERDDAVAALEGAEQRARDAEEAKAEAEKVAAEVTGERDRLAALETELRGKIAGLEADAEKVPGLVEALNAANQEIANLKAEIAKVDGDGDGKVGGSAKKPGA